MDAEYEANVSRWPNLLKRLFGLRGRARATVSSTIQAVVPIFNKSPIEYDDGEVVWWAAAIAYTAPAGRVAAFTLNPATAGLTARMVVDSIRVSASIAGNVSVVKTLVSGLPVLANPVVVLATPLNFASLASQFDYGITSGDVGAALTSGTILLNLNAAAGFVEVLTDPIPLDAARSDAMVTRVGGLVSAVTLALRGRMYPRWPE